MRILQSDLIGHFTNKGKRHCIYSSDFQPNGNRLATAGADCSIKIWDISVILSIPSVAVTTASQVGETLQSSLLLATLTTHTKAVNVVRWSKDGKYLASGSADNYISLHMLQSSPGYVSGFGQKQKNLENWIRCYTLSGHSMDVLDLDWSPVLSNGALASASVDNRVLVWQLPLSSEHASSSKILSPSHILTQHQSFVKGIAYDPIGKYLISCDSSNVVILWDSEHQYSVIQILTTPLKNSPDSTLFRHIHWAPDGSSVCLTSALKSSKPIGMILRRNDWENIADLVGHKNSTLSTRFCPYLVHYTNSTPNEKEVAEKVVGSIVALGDQDGVVSIWSNVTQRALYVFSDVFSESVTDITWFYPTSSFSKDSSNENPASTHARLLLACTSHSGEVVMIDFEEEIGEIIKNDVILDNHYQALYGRSYADIISASTASIGGLGGAGEMYLTLSSTSLRPGGKDREEVLVHNPLALQYLQAADIIIPNKKKKDKESVNNKQSTPTNGKKRVVISNEEVTLQTPVTSNLPALNPATATPTTAEITQPPIAPDVVESAATTTPITINDTVMEVSPDVPTPITPVSTTVEKEKTLITPTPAIAALLAARMNNLNTSSTSTSTAASTLPLYQQRVVIGANGKKRIRPAVLNPTTAEEEEEGVRFTGNEVSGNMLEDQDLSGGNGARKRIRFQENSEGMISVGLSSSSVSRTSSTPFTSSTTMPVLQPAHHSITVKCSTSHPQHLSFHSSLTSLQHLLLSLPQTPSTSSASSQVLSLPVKSATLPTASSLSTSHFLLQAEVLTSPEILRKANSTMMSVLGRYQPQHLLKLHLIQRSHTRQLTSSYHNLPGGAVSGGWIETLASEVGGGDEVVWSTVVTGNVTAIASIQVDHQSSATSSSVVGGGLVLVGTTEGVLQVYDVTTGMAVCPPMVLGAAVVFLDIMQVTDSDDDDESDDVEKKIRFAAMTSLGQIFLYEYYYYSSDDSRNKNEKRKRKKKMKGLRQLTLESIYLSLNATYSSIINTASTASTTPSNGTTSNAEKGKEVEVVVESMVLHASSGDPIICIKSSSTSSPSTMTSGQGKIWDYAMFKYDSDLSNWLTLYHSKYLLSCLFLSSASSSSISLLKDDDASGRGLSLKELQREGYHHNSMNGRDKPILSAKEILQITRLKMMTSNNSHGGGDNNQSNANNMTVMAWSDLITIAHAEERLNAAVIIGNEVEIFQFLQDWIRISCQVKQYKKLEAFLLTLIQLLEQDERRTSEIPSSQQFNLMDWIFNHERRYQRQRDEAKMEGEEEGEGGFVRSLVHRVILPTIATIPSNDGQLFFQDVIQRIQQMYSLFN